MKISLKTPLLILITAASGMVVVLGYFISIPELSDLRLLFVNWAIILAAMALCVGIVHLGRVHFNKIRQGQVEAVYSAVTLLSLLVTIGVVGFWGPGAVSSQWLYDYVWMPVEASLMAVLAVILLYAVARMFSRRLNVFTLIFGGTLLLVLITTVAIAWFPLQWVADLRTWVLQVWAAAGARGIVLGVALGTLATGLRILMGADRPYGD